VAELKASNNPHNLPPQNLLLMDQAGTPHAGLPPKEREIALTISSMHHVHASRDASRAAATA
jgi:hypothetical protein